MQTSPDHPSKSADLESTGWYGGDGEGLPHGVVEFASARDGWQPESWREYLLDRADRCEALHPSRAREFRQAALLMAPDLVNG